MRRNTEYSKCHHLANQPISQRQHEAVESYDRQNFKYIPANEKKWTKSHRNKILEFTDRCFME
ncbi:hypothetical protein VIBNISOn1_30042 [Vibrio nigripulchritudo SOn1]|uniref:Transposase n=1 Tax=Vibrio nigripulchritudo SOn1 TaxID=1238450 RepID=A0AAV2VRM5_9VIBR|nr:hypothetical protein VIBNISOn1_30042 [Vibrio nigripulchritudo SOn1]